MRPFIALLANDPAYQRRAFRLAILLYLVVLVVGSIPGARAEVGELATGIVLHMSTYGFFALLLFCGTQGAALTRAGKAVLIVATMGALDEYVQSFLSYRHGSVFDWFVDINAALLASLALYLLWPKEGGAKPEQLS